METHSTEVYLSIVFYAWVVLLATSTNGVIFKNVLSPLKINELTLKQKYRQHNAYVQLVSVAVENVSCFVQN